MAKVISQETFDDVVKENIVEFAMSPKEAKDETIQQFEAQGINLANIIKDLTINEETGLPVVSESIDQLKAHISGVAVLDKTAIGKCLDILTTECNKSVPHRVLAAKNGSLEVLLSITESELNQTGSPNVDMLQKLLEAFNALINKQPDIFDPETLVIAFRILETQNSELLICLVLRLMSKACVLHEINRQNIMNAEVMKFLKPLVSRDSADVIKQLCTLFRYLILDDDVRVEFGKAHDHAKAIAAEVLPELTGLLDKFIDNPALQSDLILTIASLTVRNEYCIVVEEAGGLKSIIEAMKKHSDNLKLVREVFQLLRALAGNDIVKARIIQQGAAPLITDILGIHRNNEMLVKACLMCVATLTLRSKDNSAALFETGIAEEIVEAMKLHATSKPVQRNGAWAIRNMVSRSRDLCDTFIKFGAEDVLNDAMTAHPSVAQDIKSALRDLGCKVELKEEWTGTSAIKIANN